MSIENENSTDNNLENKLIANSGFQINNYNLADEINEIDSIDSITQGETIDFESDTSEENNLKDILEENYFLEELTNSPINNDTNMTSTSQEENVQKKFPLN